MFALKTILLPVDFSQKCASAAGHVAAIASRFGSDVVLFHVAQASPLTAGPEIGPPPATDASHEIEKARAQLESFLKAELAGLQAVTREVVEGDPAREIVNRATGVDLIAMPTHGYGPFRRLLLGSVVARVLHDCDCPVWTAVHVEGTPAYAEIPLKSVACAVDLGAGGDRVLEWAWGFASKVGARLSVIHVAPSAPVALTAETEADPDAELVHEAADDIAMRLRRLNAHAEIITDSGDIVPVVHELTARVAADLLVIGRGHGKGVIGRLRSHAYPIIRESPCPVISV
jgi:nucleotide-binding universal stress UspA family protein